MVDKQVVVRLNAQTGQYQAEMGAAAASTAGFSRSVQASTAQAGSSVSSFGKIASTVGKVTILGIAAGLALSAKAAIEFESSFAGIKKTVDASEAQFAQLANTIRQMALDIPIGVNELNRIGELGGQLGVDVGDLPEFIEVIAKVGVTTTLSVEEASLAFARLDNILQLGGTQFEELGSTLVELGNNFAATESEIITFSLRIAPIGQTVGLTADQVLALATAFVSVGVPAERGGTAVQKTFIKMSEAVQDGSGALEIFGRIAGITGEAFASLFRRDPAKAFQAFVEGLDRLNKEGKNVFAVLDGIDLNNQRVISSLLAMASASDVLNETLATGSGEWETVTALTEEAEKRFDTTASKIELAKNQMNELAIEIGNNVIPVIGNLADGVGDFIAGIFELAPAIKIIIGALLLLAGGAQVGILAFSALSRVIGIDFVASMGLAGAAATGLKIVLGGALLGAIFLVVGALVSMGSKSRDTEARVRSLKAAFDAQRESFEGQVAAQQESLIISEGHEQALNRLGITANTFARAIVGEGDALAFVNDRLEFQTELLKDLGDAEIAPLEGPDFDEADEIRINQLADERLKLAEDLTLANFLLGRSTRDVNAANAESNAEERLRLEAELAERGGKRIVQEREFLDFLRVRSGVVKESTETFELQEDQIEAVADAISNYKDFMADGLEETAQKLIDNTVSWDEWEDKVVVNLTNVATAIAKRASAESDFLALITSGLLADASQAAKDFLDTGTPEQKASIVAQAFGDPEALLAEVVLIEEALDAVGVLVSEGLAAELPILAEAGGRTFMQELNAAVLAEVEGDPTGTTKPIDAWEAVIMEAIGQTSEPLQGELLDIFGSDFAITFISAMTGLGADVVAGMITGMESKLGGLSGVSSRIVATVRRGVGGTGGFQADSPSKVMMRLGEDVAEGFSIGLTTGFSKVDGFTGARHQLGQQLGGGATSTTSTANEFNLNIHGSNNPGADGQTALLAAKLAGRL